MGYELKLLKLFTSEEVIAQVLEDTDEYYILHKPRLCAMQQGKGADGKVGNYLVLLPWIMYATDPTTKTEQDIKMYKRVIAGESIEIPDAIDKEYVAVTTNIQMI